MKGDIGGSGFWGRGGGEGMVVLGCVTSVLWGFFLHLNAYTEFGRERDDRVMLFLELGFFNTGYFSMTLSVLWHFSSVTLSS